MNILHIYSRIKEIGFKNAIQRCILKILGISSYKEQIDTLYYFFNNYIDIQSLPETKDVDLRIMQKCDSILLRIFDEFCKKHNLQYWLDYGTLLGAVRHKGFIPWDDDMDVAMPRDDYEQACTLLKELKEYGIEAEEDEKGKRIGLGYMHQQTGIWLDIFPIDSFYTSNWTSKTKQELSNNILSYRKYYLKNIKRLSKEDLYKKRNEFINIEKIGDTLIRYHGPEFIYSRLLIHENNCIYPLTRIKFENFEYNAPNNLDLYLKDIYGNNYMQYPKNGIEKHDEGRGLLKTWAKRNNINMDNVYNQLIEIYSDYKKQ